MSDAEGLTEAKISRVQDLIAAAAKLCSLVWDSVDIDLKRGEMTFRYRNGDKVTRPIGPFRDEKIENFLDAARAEGLPSLSMTEAFSPEDLAMPKTTNLYYEDIVEGKPDEVTKEADLIDAATYGDHERVSKLLQSGVDPKTDDNSPLQLAAANGHFDTVRVLLSYGAEANDREALIEAAKSGYADVVGLLASYADPETRREALRLASEEHLQTPGVFGARRPTPENGHASTIDILRP